MDDLSRCLDQLTKPIMAVDAEPGWCYEIIHLLAGRGRIHHTDGTTADQFW